MKIIQIKDKGNELKFKIKLLPAVEGLDFLLDLADLLIDTPEASAKSLLQLIHNIANTGVTVEGSNSNEISAIADKILSPNNKNIEFILTLIIGAIQRLNREKRYKLIETVLQKTILVISDIDHELTLHGSMEVNVNTYIKNPLTLTILIKEFITYNVMEIFSDFL